ncbi:MAG: hypothetical protein ACREV9_15510 [Burkholderiales bacterium]
MFRDFELDYTYDFTGEDRVLDASLTYAGFGPLEIKIGQFKEPFSLERIDEFQHHHFHGASAAERVFP